MTNPQIQKIERKIAAIKEKLQTIGPMRPGSVTRQYKDRERKTGGYWQISYTRNMRSRTEYVRPEWVAQVCQQVATHRQFKRLVESWVDLAIEHSQLTMKLAKEDG